MKHEWKKAEKQYYAPKKTPEFVVLPPFKFFTICGQGNPNNAFFGEYISVLYSLSYAIKMSPKKGLSPEGYFDYTVYPLEGVWDLIDKSKMLPDGGVVKDNLAFKLMIRQPEFVTPAFAEKMSNLVQTTKPHHLLDQVKFEIIEEGPCLQMLHLGSYDHEPESFQLMEAFAAERDLKRRSKVHREIYLSDARKTAPDKLRTILRFQVD
jgi:hypothetical protein